MLLPGAGVSSGTGSGSSRRHECLDWLDAQPSSSVLYVSFGTTSSLRLEQVRELASDSLQDRRISFVVPLQVYEFVAVQPVSLGEQQSE